MPKKTLLLYVNQCPFYFYDFSAVYPILTLSIYIYACCVSNSTVYFVQFIHDLSSTYSFSQLPGVKGGAYWKFETQINVHWGAKPVMSHSHVSLPAEERPALHRREGIFG